MTVESFERALASLGVPAAVETQGNLAIVRMTELGALTDERVRAAVVSLGAAHGFTHVAVELTLETSDAALSRD